MHLSPECQWQKQSKGSRHRHSHTTWLAGWGFRTAYDTLGCINANAPVWNDLVVRISVILQHATLSGPTL